MNLLISTLAHGELPHTLLNDHEMFHFVVVADSSKSISCLTELVCSVQSLLLVGTTLASTISSEKINL